jgi:hypothetical protein
MKIYLLIMSVLIPFASFSQKKHPVNYYGSAGIGFTNALYIGNRSFSEQIHDNMPLFSYQFSVGLKKNILDNLAIGIEPNYLRRADHSKSYKYIYHTVIATLFLEFSKTKSKTGLGVTINYNFYDNYYSEQSSFNKKNTSFLIYKTYKLNKTIELKPNLYFDIYPTKEFYNGVQPYQLILTKHAYNVLISVIYNFKTLN